MASSLFSHALLAQQLTLLDRITGVNTVAIDSLFNAEGSGRQIILDRITITEPTVITRAQNISDPNVLGATEFAYAIRNASAPFAIVDSGPAILVQRSAYAPVTIGSPALQSNLDEFSLRSQPLPPGAYYISVYASGADPYRSLPAATASGGSVLVDGAGAPYLDSVSYHMLVRYFGVPYTPPGVPSLPPLALMMLAGILLLAIKRRGLPG
ncbi:MAG: hypothetical protein OIF35_13440 [Cellvibrionaceae bacterium]|nr:hypothetical protein [Cellvibrionaceae bacterium]